MKGMRGSEASVMGKYPQIKGKDDESFVSIYLMKA